MGGAAADGAAQPVLTDPSPALPPSLPPVEVVGHPCREGCAGRPQQQEPCRELGGHSTGVVMEEKWKALGFSVGMTERQRRAGAAEPSGNSRQETPSEAPRVRLAHTQHCDGLASAGPLPAQGSDKHNLSVLRPRSPAPVSN